MVLAMLIFGGLVFADPSQEVFTDSVFIESVAVGEMVYTINAAPLENAEIINVELFPDAGTDIVCNSCDVNIIGNPGSAGNINRGFADCLKFPTA